MRVLLATLSACLLLSLAASPLAAQTYFDTLGTLGDVYEDDDIFNVIGDHSAGLGGADWFQGYRFTSAASGLLHSIDVAVGHLDGPETIEFRLYADAGGALGALLETIPVAATAADFDGSLVRGIATSTTSLAQGTSYWLMAYSSAPTIWFNNELGQSLPRLWTEDGPNAPLNSDTTTAAAFRLNGPPPVPLSAPLGLFAILLASLGMASRLIAQKPVAQKPVHADALAERAT